MFDLKMCFMDLMRLSGSAGPPKPRKSLKEISDRYSSHYMQKYNDVNIIYFNENMSMTSKSNTIKFSRCPAGTFKQSPLNQSFSNRKKSIRDWEVETACFDFSSDDRATTTSGESSAASLAGVGSPGTSGDSDSISTSVKTTSRSDATECLCNFSENAVSGGQLDSFCTLCTSSFSFSHCNKCDESRCSSKCQSADEISFKSFVEKSFITRR